MDNLLETIDDIKTLIPDSKYMALMESLAKIHKKSLDRVTHYNMKRLISFLLESSQKHSTHSYLSAALIDNETFYQVLVKCKSGFDCREAGNAWLDLLETAYAKEKFEVEEYLPKCQYRTYNLCDSRDFINGSRSDEKDIEICFTFESYNQDDFVDDDGSITTLCVENAHSLGKTCLVNMAKKIMETHF